VNPAGSRQEFARLIRLNADRLDLARAALLVAAEEYPLLDPRPYLDRLDKWAYRVVETLGGGRGDPLATVAALNHVLFDEERLRGNIKDYYDPRNSFVNEVMDRRLGIPISLSLVYLEVARRADLPVAGVGLPGHFIVGVKTPARTVFVDPFHEGAVLTEKDCAGRVAKIFGGRMALRPEHLEPVSPQSVLVRLLNNLKNIYVESRSHAKAHAVIDKLVLLTPDDWAIVRDRGLVRFNMKQFKSALADLESYLNNTAEAPDRSAILKLSKSIARTIEKKG
jgi:regulator of sirC expression with transglutaminase-like and TPR domain